ncbi:mannitol 1-phosphate dehydrogenase 2 [Astrocystis sublimbata]|nr:mannitol 1-phosphate dehydrogenase 2 [Astrocystis sublimbata]
MSDPSPTKPFNLAIVGGGITGLTLAISLLKHNVPFTVYESASKFGEIGAGIGFNPNAVMSMKLISPQLEAAYRHCRTVQIDGRENIWFTTRVGDMRKAGDDGKTFEYAGQAGTKVGDDLFNIHYGDLSKVGQVGAVHRAHFLDQLVKLVPLSVCRFGKRLVDITKTTDSEDAILHFADGTTAQHTAVLGTDGIKSQTRKVLLGSDKYDAVFSGKCAYRGLVPMDKAIEAVGEEEARHAQMYFGYHGHILTYPIDLGRIMNVVAFASREKWTKENWVVGVSKEEMLADFQTWGPTGVAIISAMERQDVWALFEDPPAPTYYGTQPRICLVGDAAHASTPHQGAGASMCIEDCYIIGELLGEAKSVEDLAKVFKIYDESRRPRTQKLVTTSHEAAQVYEFEFPGVLDDMDAVKQNMQTRMRWIWDHDVAAEMERAKAAFRQAS